jgi:cysteine desulfurase
MYRPIYLDYNATTPIDPEVAIAMQPYITDLFGNPSSSHHYGMQAKKAVEEARKQLAALLHCYPDEIIFTSGGTESNNYAIKGIAFQNRDKGNHIITSSIEHPAVTEVCHFLESQGFQVSYLPVDEYGILDPEEVVRAITPDTILITVMHANNEVGTIQPVEEIAKIARKNHIPFHTDAAQSVGKIKTDVREMGVDMLTVAGHKLYAPKGVGALYIRRGTKLQKLMHGASHEQNLRAGTENVPEIVGLGKAAEIALRDFDSNSLTMHQCRDLLFHRLKKELPDIRLNGHPDLRLPNTLSISFPGIQANILLDEISEIAASAGAACHTDQIDISRVLSAMNVPENYAMGTIRFSTGKQNTLQEIEAAEHIIIQAVKRLSSGNYNISPHPTQTTDTSQNQAYKKDVYEDMPLSTNKQLPMNEVSQHQTNEDQNSIKLTKYTHGLGCACKVRPQYLEEILKELPVVTDKRILVGNDTSDDAAVYQINDATAIVQTVDFFTPIVDDPYDFGAIAAANALSDIYAMGAKPLFALNIVGFPSNRLPQQVLKDILRGASDKAAEAGIPILGGHTVEDVEPKFGMVVTGTVHPDKVITNAGAKPGDDLILTKPIGTGIISTAVKRGLADAVVARAARDVMAALNAEPALAMESFHVHACTDVTGFGLLGHLREMTVASGVNVVLNVSDIPVINGTYELAAAGAVPGGSRNNLEFVSKYVYWHDDVADSTKLILCDAQTSGGLLIALPPKYAEKYIALLQNKYQITAARIGQVTESGTGTITINP